MTESASKAVPAARLMVPLSGTVSILALMMAVMVWPDLGALLPVAFLGPMTLLIRRCWREIDPASRANEETQFLKGPSLAGAAPTLLAFFASAGDELRLLVAGPVFTP